VSYQLYPSDLTDREWEYIKRLIPAAKPGGRKRQTDMRLTVNAIFYINRTGNQWRYLPREYPPWQTVYGHFRTWRIAGVWERIHDRLRNLAPEREGGERQPTAAILDSQTVKTTDRGGPERGYDARSESTGGNGISWSIRSACLCWSKFTRPARKTATELKHCWDLRRIGLPN
jgi:putative transposase